MRGPTILGQPKSEVLSAVGVALLQVKNGRGLTAEDMADVFGLRSDDQVAKYIAGTEQIGAVAWIRATAAWPELQGLFLQQLALRTAGDRSRRQR